MPEDPGLAERWLRNSRPHLQYASAAGGTSLRAFLSLVLRGAPWDSPASDVPDSPTLEAFERDFRNRWGNLVRYRPQEARQAFLDRKVVQKKHDSVGSYHARFVSLVKQAEDMSISDQIA